MNVIWFLIYCIKIYWVFNLFCNSVILIQGKCFYIQKSFQHSVLLGMGKAERKTQKEVWLIASRNNEAGLGYLWGASKKWLVQRNWSKSFTKSHFDYYISSKGKKSVQFQYPTHAIISRSWLEAALEYKPYIRTELY